jgi:hypothetical protein
MFYSAAWYVIGQYSKNILSKDLVISQERVFSKYDKILLSGFPFKLQYKIENYIIVFKQDNFTQEIQINDSLLTTDLFSKKFLYQIFSPIIIQSSDNKLNLQINYNTPLQINYETNSPVFTDFSENSSNSFYDKIKNFSYVDSGLSIKDNGIDKIVYTSSGNFWNLNKFSSDGYLYNFDTQFSFEGTGTNEAPYFLIGKEKLAGDLLINYNNHMDDFKLTVNSFGYSTDDYNINAKGNLYLNDPTSEANFIEVSFTPLGNVAEKPEAKQEYVIKNLFIEASDLVATKDIEPVAYPLTIKITKSANEILFGNMNLYDLFIVADAISNDYEQKNNNKPTETIIPQPETIISN